MPHFVMDCSMNLFRLFDEKSIMTQIHKAAVSSELFVESEIKVQINPFQTYLVGNEHKDFIHIFAHLMEGRTDEQKESLSKLIVSQIVELFPQVENIAMNISDFEKKGYLNKGSIKTDELVRIAPSERLF